MQAWRQIAHDAKDVLTVCLAKAVDRALTAELGGQWFADFAQADAREKVSNRITKAGQASVQDLDLQALLKFLRYRSTFANQVFTYYGLFEGLDAFATDAQVRQLNDLLDRLINDFRNRIEAHSRAADIEKELSGEGLNRIYGYQEAVQDMYKLARVFDDVKDGSGVAYHRRIAGLMSRKKKRLAVIVAAVLVAALAIGGLALAFGGGSLDKNVYRKEEMPVLREGQVTVQPVKVYYDGAELVAECYVMNGTEEVITNIDVYYFKLICRGRTLAAADFGVLENTTLEPDAFVKQVFRFPKKTVLIADARLTEIEAQVKCQFE